MIYVNYYPYPYRYLYLSHQYPIISMKLFSIIALLLLIRVGSCTDEQLLKSRLAENSYLDLIYYLESNQQPGATVAAAELNENLVELRGKWRRPMSRANSTKCRFHLDEAEKSFAEARAAIKNSNLEAAKILVDRAMNELYAADDDAFTRLYSGKLYAFYTTWLEVDMIINDQMLCLMEWKEYTWWANLARSEWYTVECETPDPTLYPFTPSELHVFETAKHDLGTALNAFSQNISRGDQCSSQEHATAVTEALWSLMMSLKIAPPAETVLLD
ncbi:hypothetical protein CEQ90_11805 [Lewinellaceae bacterium SD302]|nr:hypothetical protein CEQ90_11805 [Lewinellaceae bacterium SD302]